MKRLKILMLLLIVVLWSCNKDNNETETEDEKLNVSRIEDLPYSIIDDETLLGVDVEVATTAFQNAGIEYTLTTKDSWGEAYNDLLTGSNQAMLTVGYSRERKDLFKWAGPTVKGVFCIYAKNESGIGTAIGVDASKEIESIAAVSSWLETTTLEELGFTNLVYFDSYQEALDAFLNDEVKAISTDAWHFIEMLPDGLTVIDNMDICCSYKTAFFYIAFSKDVSDTKVEKCQDAITELIKNKENYEIIKKYNQNALSLSLFTPDIVQLFTELAAPFNYFTGELWECNFTGSSVELVNELQSRNIYQNNLAVTSWTDAYDVIQYMPNSALFTVARTPEREDLFQWVGPISNIRSCFYTKTESGIQITSLEEAKALNKIATPKGWFTHDFMINNGFENIVDSNTPNEAFNLLMNDEVDALLLFDEGVKWLTDTYQIPESDISEQFEISSEKGYIAFSLDTDPAIVEKWQEQLDAMKSDGTFETIWNNWYEGIEMP